MIEASEIIELSVVGSSILVTVSTIGLWRATAQVHKDEIMKMTSALTHDNDNMTDVALTIEQDRHVENLHTLKRVSRRNRKGGVR